MTPPPTEEVIREGEDGENEQVQNEGLQPQPTPEMINQVLAYLSGLSDQGLAPPVFITPTPLVSEVQHEATRAVARGRVAARGRGRGRGRTSSRRRGRAPSPSDTRAVTPPPTEEVIREGEDGETEQVQNEENATPTYPRDDQSGSGLS